MEKDFLKFTGKDKGLTSIILVGVHGNEKCGIKALEKILPSLDIKRGEVFVGFGNPLAIKRNKRYIDANLNRIFKDKKLLSENEKNSYEYKRAQFLKKYFNKADVLLDIHASSIPNSPPFIICENNAMGIAKYLPFDVVAYGFDKIQPGGTDSYMNSRGKIGIGVECGYLINDKSIKVAEKSILDFLILQKHIDGTVKKRKQSLIKIYKQYITKTNKFRLSKKFKNFERLSKNQTIGFDGKKEIKTPQENIIIFAHNKNKIGEEAFLLGKYKRV